MLSERERDRRQRDARDTASAAAAATAAAATGTAVAAAAAVHTSSTAQASAQRSTDSGDQQRSTAEDAPTYVLTPADDPSMQTLPTLPTTVLPAAVSPTALPGAPLSQIPVVQAPPPGLRPAVVQATEVLLAHVQRAGVSPEVMDATEATLALLLQLEPTLAVAQQGGLPSACVPPVSVRPAGVQPAHVSPPAGAVVPAGAPPFEVWGARMLTHAIPPTATLLVGAAGMKKL